MKIPSYIKPFINNSKDMGLIITRVIKSKSYNIFMSGFRVVLTHDKENKNYYYHNPSNNIIKLPESGELSDPLDKE